MRRATHSARHFLMECSGARGLHALRAFEIGRWSPTPTGSNPLSPPSPSYRDEGGARADAAGEGWTSGPLSHAERAPAVPTPHATQTSPVCRGACGPTPTGSNPLSPPSPSHRDEGGARVDAAGEGGTSGPLSHAERASTVPTPHATQTARSAAAHVGPGIPYFGLCGVGLHGSERTETLCQTHGISLCVGSCVRAFTK
jgi:hypothetical protein